MEQARSNVIEELFSDDDSVKAIEAGIGYASLTVCHTVTKIKISGEVAQKDHKRGLDKKRKPHIHGCQEAHRHSQPRNPDADTGQDEECE